MVEANYLSLLWVGLVLTLGLNRILPTLSPTMKRNKQLRRDVGYGSIAP